MSEDIDIWAEHLRLQKERSDFIEECTKDYDVGYYKRLAELRKLCGERGHKRGNFHSNGLGTSWYWCHYCGDRMEVTRDFEP